MREFLSQICFISQKSVRTVGEYPQGEGRNLRKDSSDSGNFQPEKMDRSLDSSRLVLSFRVEMLLNTFKSAYWKKFFY